jgi:acyl carrier protein
MSESRLMERVTAIVAEALDQPVSAVTPTASLVTDLGAESLDFIDLTFRIESAFGIKIVELDLWRDVNVATAFTPTTIVDYLKSRGVTDVIEAHRD